MNPETYTWKPKPTFKDSIAKQRYWEKEKERWINGYKGLTGEYYFYLQESFIKHRSPKIGQHPIERPKFRASDLWIFQAIEKAKKEKKMLGVIKARTIGFSTIGGGLVNAQSRIYPGSTSLITSKKQSNIKTIFNEKIYIPYTKLDKDIRPVLISSNNTTQNCRLEMAVPYYDSMGEEDVVSSVVNCRETSEKPSSPTNFSTEGASFGFYDELPLHPRKKELLTSSMECYKDPETKQFNGFLLWGGTCEKELGNEQLTELKGMIEDKDMWDCEILFIPFWWCFGLDEGGYPDEKAAYEWWEKEAEKKKNNQEEYNGHLRNHPRTMEDIFESVKGDRWEDMTLDVLIAQKREVLNADVSCPKYKFTNLNRKIEIEKNNSGKFWMLEQVQPMCKYAILIDGIAKGTEIGSQEGSQFASLVMKTLDPKGTQFLTVNIYCERPKTTEHAHENVLNQILHYNQYGGVEIIQMEANAGIDGFFTFMKKEGFHHLIGKAKDLSGKGWTDKKNVGQQRTTRIIEFQYEMANIFIRKYPMSLQMMPLIEELLTPMAHDSHIVDAWLQFFCAFPEFDEKPKTKPKPKPRTSLTIAFDENGYSYFREVAF